MISHFEDPSGPLFGKKTSKTAFLAVFGIFWQKRGFFTVFSFFVGFLKVTFSNEAGQKTFWFLRRVLKVVNSEFATFIF